VILVDFRVAGSGDKHIVSIPANENIFCVCARIIAVRQGRIDRCVLVAVRKVKPDAALRQIDRADAENVFVRGYTYLVRTLHNCVTFNVTMFLIYFVITSVIRAHSVKCVLVSDHSMATAFEAVGNIVSGRNDKENIWNVNTEQEYHEEKN